MSTTNFKTNHGVRVMTSTQRELVSKVYGEKSAKESARRDRVRATTLKAGDKLVSRGQQGFVVSNGFVDYKTLMRSL